MRSICPQVGPAYAPISSSKPLQCLRVLREAGLMQKHNCKPSLKGKGFQQPLKPHEH
jgi:hypothetical protein